MFDDFRRVNLRLPDNGKKLESIVLELAHLNGLDDDFIEWLEGSNYFCNSLVDRIVTGMPSEEERITYFNHLGYKDELLTVSEVYSLWAIEGDNRIKDILSFHLADDGVKIEPDIHMYRELKLRLLNGTHTLSCGVAFLADFGTVRSAMDDTNMSNYLEELMKTEIGSSISLPLDNAIILDFTTKVLDRFRNPHIRHFWKNICQNYSQKMKLRNLPLLLNYYEKYNAVPDLFAFGFAAYIFYMKAIKQEHNDYFGEANGAFYLIDDDMAARFFKHWKSDSPAEVVSKVLKDVNFWNDNLSLLPGFDETVSMYLDSMISNGMKVTLENVTTNKMMRNEP